MSNLGFYFRESLRTWRGRAWVSMERAYFMKMLSWSSSRAGLMRYLAYRYRDTLSTTALFCLYSGGQIGNIWVEETEIDTEHADGGSSGHPPPPPHAHTPKYSDQYIAIKIRIGRSPKSTLSVVWASGLTYEASACVSILALVGGRNRKKYEHRQHWR